MEQSVKIAFEKNMIELSIEELQEFQGNLKSLHSDDYEALKSQILETGFAFPIYVWKSPKNEHKIIGGHQRLRVLKQMKLEGIAVPKLPVVVVHADSERMAKQRVLQDASQYGKVERQGLYEFSIENSLDPGMLAKNFKLPEINWPSFNAEFFMDTVGPSETKEKQGSVEYSAEDFDKFAHKCPRCGFEFDE